MSYSTLITDSEKLAEAASEILPAHLIKSKSRMKLWMIIDG